MIIILMQVNFRIDEVRFFFILCKIAFSFLKSPALVVRYVYFERKIRAKTEKSKKFWVSKGTFLYSIQRQKQP